MDENKLEKAYFRHLKRAEQCELSFLLEVSHERFGHLNENIKSTRKAKDTIGSLLQHTKNKLIHIIQQKLTSEIYKGDDIDVRLIRNGANVSGDITCLDFVNYKNKVRFVVFNKWYRVLVNAPLLQELSVPSFIYSDSTVTPSRFHGIYVDKNLSKFTWSRSLDKISWSEVSCNYNYNTTDEDVGYYLKVSCVPKNSHNEGVMVEAISQNAVEVMCIIQETFPFEDRHAYTSTKLEGNNIRVVTYNVLAERYTLDNQFEYCDEKYLSIEYRKQLLLKEIIGYNADILCLQEVDSSSYTSFFRDFFISHGYRCNFNKKGNKIPEGLLCIYNKSRFTQVAHDHIVFANELRTVGLFSDLWALIKRNRDVKELFLKQQTSLQLTALKLEKTDNILIVANTHLYYHREAGHIRLLQVTMAMKYISKWIKTIKQGNNEKVSVIFCGDFNTRPDSGVYHFITKRNLKNCQEELEKIGHLSLTSAIKHIFNFESACGTPKFTNYTEDFKGCLDYIFVDKSNISVTNVVPFPVEQDLSRFVALPNKNFPSDHVALVADLSLH